MNLKYTVVSFFTLLGVVVRLLLISTVVTGGIFTLITAYTTKSSPIWLFFIWSFVLPVILVIDRRKKYSSVKNKTQSLKNATSYNSHANRRTSEGIFALLVVILLGLILAMSYLFPHLYLPLILAISSSVTVLVYNLIARWLGIAVKVVERWSYTDRGFNFLKPGMPSSKQIVVRVVLTFVISFVFTWISYLLREYPKFF